MNRPTNIWDRAALPVVSWPVHPTRTRARRPDEGRPHLFVVHTSEQPKATTSSAEALARFVGTPRTVDPKTGKTINTASYHWGVDLDTIAAMVPPDDIAYHAPPNWRGEGCCLTGAAARDWTGTTDDVDDWPELRLAARLTAVRCLARGWPIRWLTPDLIRAGEAGICGHVDVNHAFGLSDHTDPGVGFPRDAFLELVRAAVHDLTTDPTEDPMQSTARLVRFEGTANVFLIGCGPALHLTGRSAADYANAGVPTIVLEQHAQGRKSILAQAGLTEADVVKDPTS